MAMRIFIFCFLVFFSTFASAGYITGVPLSNWIMSYSSHAGGVRYSSRGAFYFPKISPDKVTYCSKKKHRCKSVHYLWRNVSGTLPQGKHIEIKFLLRDWGTDAEYNWKTEPTNTCDNPAKVSVILYNGSMSSSNGRFWNKVDRPTLIKGDHEITIRARIYRYDWINVNGKTPSKSAFRSMKKNVKRIGVTFGGGCFYGHGVNITNGKAHFKLTSVKIR